jgi:hypothetical protein
MSTWSDDFSACSLEEILRSQAENREWSKELRKRASALVNDRLAKNISQDDYAADRKQSQELAAECRRRAAIIDTQIVQRKHHAMAR